jgi:hypothetical protein
LLVTEPTPNEALERDAAKNAALERDAARNAAPLSFGVSQTVR